MLGGFRRRRRHRGETAESKECNTRSTFEIFRYNICNINLKVDETLETYI
jgi:hypothetical protein